MARLTSDKRQARQYLRSIADSLERDEIELESFSIRTLAEPVGGAPSRLTDEIIVKRKIPLGWI